MSGRLSGLGRLEIRGTWCLSVRQYSFRGSPMTRTYLGFGVAIAVVFLISTRLVAEQQKTHAALHIQNPDDLKTGGFHSICKGTHHYAFTKGAAIIQLHGNGPWGITYVSPSDDPRKTATK
jgi:hypothetical protein